MTQLEQLNVKFVELRKLEKDKITHEQNTEERFNSYDHTTYDDLNVSLTYLCNLRCIAIAVNNICFSQVVFKEN